MSAAFLLKASFKNSSLWARVRDTQAWVTLLVFPTFPINRMILIKDLKWE